MHGGHGGGHHSSASDGAKTVENDDGDTTSFGVDTLPAYSEAASPVGGASSASAGTATAAPATVSSGTSAGHSYHSSAPPTHGCSFSGGGVESRSKSRQKSTSPVMGAGQAARGRSTVTDTPILPP